MTIVVLGKTGQVGRALASELSGRDVIVLGRDAADFGQPASLAATVEALRPTIIVNAVAYTAVDKAEDEADLAFRVNAESVAALARVAERTGAWVIHYSTDYVFDGRKPSPYLESDPPAPQNVYGRSKLEGERALSQSGAPHLILRTSWVHGATGNNFMAKILNLAMSRDELSVIDDQIGAPTSAALIARVSRQAIDAVQREGAPEPGVYHLAATGETSWFEYAKYVLAVAAAAGRQLRVAPNQVRPVSSSAFASKAQRPLNSRLATDKLRRALGIALPAWQDDVHETLDVILERGAA